MNGQRSAHAIAWSILTGALVYLATFVNKGWVPHDEGMLGQIAESVRAGGIPHVDYVEPYTGGLSYVYACVFAVFGVDLLNIRFVMFGVAIASACILYALLRRPLTPVPAAIATAIGLAWSFPNYFAGLPSWWLLLAALVEVWSLFRFLETQKVRYAACAGLAVGCAFAIKQTGAYFYPPLVLSLLAAQSTSPDRPFSRRFDLLLRAGVALGTLAVAIVLLRARLQPAEILHLLVPIAAVSAAILTPALRTGTIDRRILLAIVVATAAAVAPLAPLVAPYVLRGDLREFVNGVFVLPQRRLMFTDLPMLSAGLFVFGIWVIVCMFPAPRSFSPTDHRVVAVARWMLAVGVPVLALWSTTAYHAVWQSTRSVAAMLAPVMVWLLAAGRIADVRHRQFVFASLAVLAWASLCQYPFAAPIYFCYVFPLAVVGAVMLFAATGWIQRPGLKPWAGMLLVFPILAMHPSWVVNVGQRFQRRVFDRPLGVARATLIVTPADADKYSRLTRLVSERLRAGRLLAGPDCPEVYFLTGQLSPVGVSYDFFSDRSTFDPALWPSADVVVINRSPRFSTPLAPEMVAAIRREFGQSELLGEFEVRWR